MNLASSLGIHSFKLIEYLVKIYLFSLKDFTENVLETHTQTGREREIDRPQARSQRLLPGVHMGARTKDLSHFVVLAQAITKQLDQKHSS